MTKPRGLRKGERRLWRAGSPEKTMRNADLCRLRAARWTYRAIAARYGLSVARVWRIVQRDADRTPPRPLDPPAFWRWRR